LICQACGYSPFEEARGANLNTVKDDTQDAKKSSGLMGLLSDVKAIALRHFNERIKSPDQAARSNDKDLIQDLHKNNSSTNSQGKSLPVQLEDPHKNNESLALDSNNITRKESKENNYSVMENTVQGTGITERDSSSPARTTTVENEILADSNNITRKESKENDYSAMENTLQRAGITERDSSSSARTTTVEKEVKQPKYGRQKSLQTVVIRKTQVEDALERWRDIVEFCKGVRLQSSL